MASLYSLLLVFGIFLFTKGDFPSQVTQTLDWSEPLNLSMTAASSGFATIVADHSGVVHVFWNEDLGGPPHPADTAPSDGNAIMHRQLHSGGWTEPVDIVFAGHDGRISGHPSVIVDNENYLNLLWVENTSLLFSRAPAWNAANASAWSPPEELANGRFSDFELVDIGDRLMAIYSSLSDDPSSLKATTIVESSPTQTVELWQGLGGTAAFFLSAAVDGNDRIHVIWEVNTPPEAIPIHKLRYAYSDDGILFESRLVTEDTGEESSYMQAPRPWVSIRGQDEIHLQWAQGKLTYRHHQYSMDGGDNWTDPVQIWPGFVSQTESAAYAEDGDGILYWADQFRYPSGTYLTKWMGNRWDQPDLFYLMQQTSQDSLGDRINAHGLRMAISSGNQLHVVFQDQDRSEIWYMERSLPATYVAPQPTLTSIPVPELVATEPVLNQEISSLPTPASQALIIENPSVPSTNPSTLPALGILPIVLMMMLLIGFTMLRRKLK